MKASRIRGEGTDLRVLFDLILERIPPPAGDPNGPLQALVANLDYSDYLGRLAIGRVFQGTVTRTAGAIDPTSRTMRAEVQVPNPDGLLLAGSYATVLLREFMKNGEIGDDEPDSTM